MTADGADPLLELLAASTRGPRREGLFAVWLTTRVALDQGLEPPLPERAQRRRIEALERRLARLSLSPPLRRALAGTLALLRDPGTRPAAMALQQLTAPVRETLGVEAAEVIAKMVRAARQGG
ncbi:MAG: hypothetical protein H6Q77_2204 [Gemmatimonadetes bacterium]|nr:hypothetical protein [Gemmatimonadota bacterium]